MDEKLISNLIIDKNINKEDIQKFLNQNQKFNKDVKDYRRSWLNEFEDLLISFETKYVKKSFELGFDLSLIILGKKPFFNDLN